LCFIRTNSISSITNENTSDLSCDCNINLYFQGEELNYIYFVITNIHPNPCRKRTSLL
jgi:hypothetical protein